jgi:hypothetical protein
MAKKKKIVPHWIPVFITGSEGFAQKLVEALSMSGLPFMPGYFHDSSARTAHTLIWVDEHTSLDEYKRAIGARTIWKYRIRFFRTLQEFTQFACKPVQEEELETAA